MAVITFKDRLKEAMGDESTNAFAKKCECTEGTLRSYLKGSSLPGLDKLLNIAKAANVSIQWLATGESEIKPLLQACSVVEGQAVFQIKGQRNGEYQVLDSRTAAIVDYFKALREDDKKAFEQIAETLANANTIIKKKG